MQGADLIACRDEQERLGVWQVHRGLPGKACLRLTIDLPADYLARPGRDHVIRTMERHRVIPAVDAEVVGGTLIFRNDAGTPRTRRVEQPGS